MKRRIGVLVFLVMLVPAILFAGGEKESGVKAKKKIGIAAAHYTNSWNIINTQTLLSTFEDAGFDVVWNEARNDTATQVANVNDLIAQGIDYLLIKPKEEEGLVPAILACKEAGVKVILLDRTVNAVPGEDFVTGIRTNAVLAGQRVGEWIVKKFPNGANIVEITGTPGSTTSIDRTNGLKAAIANSPNVKIIATQPGDFKRTTAQTVTENLWEAYGSRIDVIVSQNDEMTLGILQALDGRGIVPGKDVVIAASGDGAVQILNEVINGRVGAVAECTPFLAPQALEVVQAIERGESVPTNIWANERFFTIENAAREKENGTFEM